MAIIANPKSVTWSGKTFPECTAVSWSHAGAAVPVGGDGDTYPTAIVPGMAAVNVTVSCNDVDTGTGAATLYVDTALSITFEIAQSTSATLSIANAMYVGDGGSAGYGAPGTTTYSFQAFSSDGTTNPITWSGA